jgi:D-alanyl-D-alanine carboxypeptidase/D-alanyl-D-alanine carboxypeptidase (penicillin-binding protein 5/6)
MVVIDGQNGRIIFSKNENEILPMASTTKIMTALLTIQSGMDLEEYFTVDPTAIMVEGTSMGLKKGDKVNLYALCVGMLLSSGNDAANAAAVRVAGSVENFVLLMNKKARQMGLKDTHFETPSGLDGKNHHTTAKELALIAKEALNNPTFKSICSKINITVSFGAPPFNRTLYNHNRLLRQYSGTVGVKTGFTKKSGRCLVSACERDGVKLICVTLNAPNDWSDHTRLYDEAFGSLNSVTLSNNDDYSVKVTGGDISSVILKEQKSQVSLTTQEYKNVKRFVEIPPFVYAPVNIGDKCGEVVYTLYGEEILRTPLVATQTTKKIKHPQNFLKKLWQGIEEKLCQNQQ